jgi:ATP:ADP antiporter, AAA family
MSDFGENQDQPSTLTNKLSQFFRIYPEERWIFIVLALVFFCNSLATQIASVASVSGFLKGNGVNQIPIVWIVDMVVILFTAGLQSLVIDKFERTKLVKFMILGFAFIFVVLRILFYVDAPSWLSYGMMLIVSEQQWLFFPLVFWTLAQDVFSVAQAKRLFSPLASIGFIGRLLGLGVVSVSPYILDRMGIAVEDLLFLNVALYLIAYFLVLIGLKKIDVRITGEQRGTIREIFAEGWEFVKSVPAFRYLTISIFAINLGLTFAEFGFLAITHQAYSGNYQTFFGLYRLGLTVLSFLMQGFVTSRLIEKMTLKNSFLLMPFALFGGAIWMLFAGTASAIGGFVLPKVAQFTAYDSARRSFQSLAPEERRGRVSIFMESYLFAIGVIIASLLILGVLFAGKWIGENNASYIYRGLAVISSLWAVWAIIKMRQVYDDGMLNWRLKRRQRGASVLDKLKF